VVGRHAALAKDVVATYDLIMAPEVTEVVFKTELEKWKRPRSSMTRPSGGRRTRRRGGTSTRSVTSSSTRPPDRSQDLPRRLEVDAARDHRPYTLGASESGQYFEMVRVKDWWGAGKRQFIGLFNFDSIYRKVINEDDITSSS